MQLSSFALSRCMRLNKRSQLCHVASSLTDRQKKGSARVVGSEADTVQLPQESVRLLERFPTEGRSFANSSEQSQNGSLGIQLQEHSYFKELSIKNFALVSGQALQLKPGLNVITGESGAGKSVLVTALGQILGASAPENCIRQPANEAVIEGRVQLTASSAASLQKLVESHGVSLRASTDPGSAHEWLLRREILRGEKEGTFRSRSFINGVSVSQKVLREVGQALVDVNGQHIAQNLRNSSTQIELLDRLAGTRSEVLRFSKLFSQLKTIEAELKAFDELGDEAVREDLQNMVNKIGELNLAKGEEIGLRRRIRQMEARKANVEQCAVVRTMMVGDDSGGGVEDALFNVEANLRLVLDQEQAQASLSNPSMNFEDEALDTVEEEPVAEDALLAAMDNLQAARENLSAAESQVAAYAQNFRFSPQEHAESRERLRSIEVVLREYRCRTTEELLSLADQAYQDLEHWYNSQGSREDKEKAIAQIQAALVTAGCQLSLKRREAAGKLRAAVEACLMDLSMAGSRFDVRVGWETAHDKAVPQLVVPGADAALVFEEGGQAYKIQQNGLDAVEFLFAAGPAEPLRPLGAVASGGEKSRVMLALKAAPATIQMQASCRSPGTGDADANSSSEQPLAADTTVLPGQADSAKQAQSHDAGSTPVLVLDELDSGVGARLGMSVGKILQQMVSSNAPHRPSQILCVSHLPQVAAGASHHICVRKGEQEDGRIVTYFAALNDDLEKLQEVAAMGGIREEEARLMMLAAQQNHV